MRLLLPDMGIKLTIEIIRGPDYVPVLGEEAMTLDLDPHQIRID